MAAPRNSVEGRAAGQRRRSLGSGAEARTIFWYIATSSPDDRFH